MNRAYSILTTKAVDDEKRVISGVATTPTPDRAGDIVEPLGVEFKNPLPLLHQHKSDKPVGQVKFSKPTKDGIQFEARLPKIENWMSPSLIDRIETAWSELKAGLVRGVSIGFKPLEYSFMDDGGVRFSKTEVLELSLVTIPANVDATILSIKSIDAGYLAATGTKGREGITHPPGVTGPVKIKLGPKEGKMARKTFAEQIADYSTTRQGKAKRMAEIMDAAGTEGETLNSELKQEYDTLKSEVKELDEHIARLKDMEALAIQQAVPVTGDNPDVAAQSRSAVPTVGAQPVLPVAAAPVLPGVRVTGIKSMLPPGVGFARMIMAKYSASKEMCPPWEIAKQRWPEQPELQIALKAAVAVGSTTNMSPLVEPQILASEFIEYLWPRTILGRIPGLRRVPFNIKVQRQVTVSSVNWVGEGKPKPVSKGTFDTVTLGFYKIAGIVGLTDELLRFSNPAAEALVRDELAAAIIKLMDKDFLDPEKAAVANVSPASVSNDVTAVTATGTAYSNFSADVASVMANFDAADIDTSDLVVVTRSRLARNLGMMLNALGQPIFPGAGATGGTLLGYPLVTSSNVDYTEDSPQEGDNIFFLKASEIFLADDGGVSLDLSREASVQMDSAPDDPATASTVMISAFQNNLVFIRAERYVNWLKRRTGAVQYIKAAKYA